MSQLIEHFCEVLEADNFALQKLWYDLEAWFPSEEEMQAWLHAPVAVGSNITAFEAIQSGNIPLVQDAFDGYVLSLYA